MSLIKYSFVGLHPISQTFGGEVEVWGGQGVRAWKDVRPPLTVVYILKQIVAPDELYSLSEDRWIHVPSCFQSPAFVLLPGEKKKRKRKRKKKSGQHSQATLVSVRFLLTIWKKNGAEACGLLYRNCLSLAFRTVV